MYCTSIAVTTLDINPRFVLQSVVCCILFIVSMQLLLLIPNKPLLLLAYYYKLRATVADRAPDLAYGETCGYLASPVMRPLGNWPHLWVPGLTCDETYQYLVSPVMTLVVPGSHVQSTLEKWPVSKTKTKSSRTWSKKLIHHGAVLNIMYWNNCCHPFSHRAITLENGRILDKFQTAVLI